MRTAIFVFGLYRQFEQAAPFWEDTYSRYNPDYYFSLWDYSREVCKYSRLSEEEHFDIERNVTESMILKYFPDATISLHTEELGKWRKRIASKIWFTLKKCAEMCENSGNDYDLIIVKRADSIEYFKYNLSDSLQPNTIYTNGGAQFNKDKTPHYDFFDPLWYGSPEAVIRFINEFYETKYYRNGVRCHIDPDKFLHESDFKMNKFLSWMHLIIRPNMISMFDGSTSVIDFFRDKKSEINTAEGKWYFDLRPTLNINATER